MGDESSTLLPHRPATTYRSDIDGLRALAVFMVIVYHQGGTVIRPGFFVPTNGIEARCPGGFTGVDVFFVISDFVVSGSLRTESSFTAGNSSADDAGGQGSPVDRTSLVKTGGGGSPVVVA